MVEADTGLVLPDQEPRVLNYVQLHDRALSWNLQWFSDEAGNTSRVARLLREEE